MVAQDQNGVTVRARFPEALEVYLVGSFNDWSTVATPMETRNSGHWEVRLPNGSDLRGYFFFVWDVGRRLGNSVFPHPVKPDSAE